MSEKTRQSKPDCAEGEYQRTDGRHRYRYIDEDGKEKKVYSWRLDKNDRPMVALHWEKYLQHIVEKYNKIYRIQMPKVPPMYADTPSVPIWRNPE